MGAGALVLLLGMGIPALAQEPTSRPPRVEFGLGVTGIDGGTIWWRLLSVRVGATLDPAGRLSLEAADGQLLLGFSDDLRRVTGRLPAGVSVPIGGYPR